MDEYNDIAAKTGEKLLAAEQGNVKQLQEQWFEYLNNLKQETGEA